MLGVVWGARADRHQPQPAVSGSLPDVVGTSAALTGKIWKIVLGGIRRFSAFFQGFSDEKSPDRETGFLTPLHYCRAIRIYWMLLGTGLRLSPKKMVKNGKKSAKFILGKSTITFSSEGVLTQMRALINFTHLYL